MNSPDLSYTLPPPGLIMPAVIQDYMVIAFGGGALLLALYASYLAITRRSILPLLFLLAGWLTVLLEPIADVMGNAIHPPVGQYNVFVTEGHPIPLHIFLSYIWYFGSAQILLFDRMRAQSITPAFWWKTFWISLVCVTLVEQLPLHYGIWVYYGVQPKFTIGYQPAWMAFANVASVMLPAMVVYKLFPLLTGWRQFLVLGIVPATAMGGHAGAGLPMYNALGQNTQLLPPWIMELASFATIGLAVLLVWVAIQFLYPAESDAVDATIPRRDPGALTGARLHPAE